MSARIEKLKHLCDDHPYYEPLIKKISESDFDIIVHFIDDHSDLGSNEFKGKVVRMFLDQEKPKNLSIIEDVLIAIA